MLYKAMIFLGKNGTDNMHVFDSFTICGYNYKKLIQRLKNELPKNIDNKIYIDVYKINDEDINRIRQIVLSLKVSSGNNKKQCKNLI